MPLFDTIKIGNSVVKIYSVTNRDRPFLSLSYNWAGERKQRLLRHASQADERKARALARDLATAMHNGRADQLNYFADDQRIFKAAQDALSKLDLPVDAACREYAQAREVIGNAGTVLDAAEYFRRGRPTAAKPISTKNAVEEYLANGKKDGYSLRHLQDLRHRLHRFADAFQVPLAQITTSEMQTWLRDMDVAPRTRNNYRERISAFFRWAQTEGYLRKDVKTEAEALKKVKTESEIHIFTPDQAQTLLEGADTMANSTKKEERTQGLTCIHFLVLGLFPGIRRKEIERMTDKNIRFEHNDIEVRAAQAKGQKYRQGRRRLVPIQPNVRSWLDAYPVPEGRLVMSEAFLFLRALATKLTIPWHHNVMRHSAISYAVASTGNVDLVALWSGNSRDVIYESYLNQVTPAEAAAWGSIMPKHAPKNIVRLPKRA
jgi:site-specific recombinase XerD